MHLAKKLKKLCNMKKAVIPIIIGALENRLGERTESIQTTALKIGSDTLESIGDLGRLAVT